MLQHIVLEGSEEAEKSCANGIEPSQHIVLGRYRPASKRPFKWRFAGVPMVAHV